MASKFTHLIVDTSAFIKNKALNDIAENIYTVPEVRREIKNKSQLRRLCTLPYDLQLQAPDPENVQFIIEFAKKTGDYLSLSSIDIKVIALTYQFEKRLVGSEHLKTEPIQRQTIISKEKPIELVQHTPVAGFYAPKSKTGSENESTSEKHGEEEQEDVIEDDSETEDNTDKIEISIIDDLEKLNVTEEKMNEILESVKRNSVGEDESDEYDGESDEDEEDDGSFEEDDDDDDAGWITPGNVKDIKRTFDGDSDQIPTTKVACMSTDYAIQNVLKQIGLNVASFDGKVIKEMRTYILRCYACFKTTTIVTKMFCPNCGNKTLKRVAISLDENGKQVIHVNIKRPLSAKNKNKSLPRPRGGKHSCNPVLFEDQPLPKQMPTRVARTKTDALDEDYTAGYSPFVTRDIDSKSAILRGKGNLKQWVKNNEYQNSRRFMKKH